MHEWLRHILPGGAHPVLDWLLTPSVIGAFTLVSLALLVASVVGLPWFVSRLPQDYFVRRDTDGDAPHSVIRNPRWRRLVHIAKNVLGVVLLIAGLAMLVLPGQGVLTLVVALVCLDFPGKRALERKLVERPRVLGALNALRRRAGREPLSVD